MKNRSLNMGFEDNPYGVGQPMLAFLAIIVPFLVFLSPSVFDFRLDVECPVVDFLAGFELALFLSVCLQSIDCFS